MVRFKPIIFILVIGTIVLFSGCADNKDTNIESAPPVQTPAGQTPAGQTPAGPTPVPTPTATPPPFQVQIAEAKVLEDCVVAYGSRESCYYINLEVKNNNGKSVDFKIIKDTVVITQTDKDIGSRYDTQIGLSDSCVRPSGLEFKLDAASHKNIAMCYPPVGKNEKLTFNVVAMVNGIRKEYKFDLAT